MSMSSNSNGFAGSKSFIVRSVYHKIVFLCLGGSHMRSRKPFLRCVVSTFLLSMIGTCLSYVGVQSPGIRATENRLCLIHVAGRNRYEAPSKDDIQSSTISVSVLKLGFGYLAPEKAALTLQPLAGLTMSLFNIEITFGKQSVFSVKM